MVETEYVETIKAYVEKRYLRKVQPDESSATEVFYLSRFPVIRMDKTTSKVRIVFNCSTKTDGLSLNDVIVSRIYLMSLFGSEGALLLLHVTLKKCICK